LARLRWLSILPIACLLLAGCNKFQHKKPDPTKGVVTGVVLCSDTGKPARFATVILTAVPKKGEKSDDADPLPAAETTVTDLDGRFRLEAVQPGHYYAFATLEGYLDPEFALDPDKLKSLSTGWEQRNYSIAQWKDHLTEVTVGVRRVSEVSIQIERAAEISALPQDGKGRLDRCWSGFNGFLDHPRAERQPRPFQPDQPPRRRIRGLRAHACR